MTIINALDEIASLKEAEAKAYRNLAKVMVGVAENTKGIPATEALAEADTPKETPKKAARTKEAKNDVADAEITIEQVRAVMAEKSQAGLTAEVKEVLKSFGAIKVSAVKPEDYAALLEEIKKIG